MRTFWISQASFGLNSLPMRNEMSSKEEFIPCILQTPNEKYISLTFLPKQFPRFLKRIQWKSLPKLPLGQFI
jgi:hypothetical protein